jgi:hypothetical protein
MQVIAKICKALAVIVSVLFLIELLGSCARWADMPQDDAAAAGFMIGSGLGIAIKFLFWAAVAGPLYLIARLLEKRS